MAGVKGKGTLFTEKEYDDIKAMLDLGLSMAQVSRISKRSSTLVSMVNRTGDFAHYQVANRERYNKPAPGTMAARLEEQPKPEPVAKTVVRTNDDKFIEVIARVANALERIADAWETPIERQAKEFKFFGGKK